MHWLTQLFTQHESVAYTAVIYALTIFSGARLAACASSASPSA